MLKGLKKLLGFAPETTPASRVALINVRDYPGSEYSAYWEIGVRRNVDGSCTWIARILTRGEPVNLVENDPFLLEQQRGEARDEATARANSQSWVKGQMHLYRRESKGVA